MDSVITLLGPKQVSSILMDDIFAAFSCTAAHDTTAGFYSASLH
jgi:hypothetical protein